jgi:hypothetical protein
MVPYYFKVYYSQLCPYNKNDTNLKRDLNNVL